MKSKPLVVFAYAFRHKKTYDFIKTLINSGFSELYVIAAPKVLLENIKVNSNNTNENIPTAKELSKKYGFKYLEVAHNSVEQIQKFIPNNIKTAIIAGARILKKEVINIFELGVINFHPGQIPETSGLDSFYWMVNKGTKPGITVHYIDDRVDAGDFIFFHQTNLDKVVSDTELKEEIYSSQILSLERLLKFFDPDKRCITKKICRPNKNQPMNDSDKKKLLSEFKNWLKEQKYKEAKILKCYLAIKEDNIKLLKNNFMHEFINYKNNKGRGMLSEAAYFNSIMCLRYLIKKNCDVNEINDKGTTPLMYSKSLLLNDCKDNRFEATKIVIKILKDNGADVNKKDYYGKTIFDYLVGINKNKILEELIK